MTHFPRLDPTAATQQPAAVTQQQHCPLARPLLLLRSSNTVRWRGRCCYCYYAAAAPAAGAAGR